MTGWSLQKVVPHVPLYFFLLSFHSIFEFSLCCNEITGEDVNFKEWDVHCVAATLKSILRELPGTIDFHSILFFDCTVDSLL